VSDAAALVIFCGLVFLISAIHARRKLMRRTTGGSGSVENVRTSTRHVVDDGEARNRNAKANSRGATYKTCGGCPRCDGSPFEAPRETLRALATPVRHRDIDPLDMAAAIIVPAIVFLCWLMLTLLVIAHEKADDQRRGREAETESLTRT
jgi:hypothetical protein